MKKIDLEKSVLQLTQQHPELIDILADLGLVGLKNPLIRNTVGRKMTIPGGCKRLGLELEEVKKKLSEKGFSVPSTVKSVNQ